LRVVSNANVSGLSAQAPQTLLGARLLYVRDRYCTPRPGALSRSASITLAPGERGPAIVVKTTPENREVTQCVEAYVRQNLDAYANDPWSLTYEARVALPPMFTQGQFRDRIYAYGKSYATSCTSTVAESREVTITASARRGDTQLAIEVSAPSEQAATCVKAKLDAELRRIHSVQRTSSDGTSRPFFRVDADVSAKVQIRLDPPSQSPKPVRPRPVRPREWPRLHSDGDV
jgi:hypothetical protein